MPSLYTEHFGLTGEPFSLSPDPHFLYLSPGHAEALAALRLGIEGRRGLMVMTGEVGTGKTTLLYALLSDIGPNVRSAYVSNTTLSFDGLLRHAMVDLGLRPAGGDRAELLSQLNQFLGECADDGTIVALVVDEAQNLDVDTFENLRLLTNFETYNHKLLQIVLVGQPELETKLRLRSLRQVAERVAVHCRVAPLNRRERRRYLEYRLARAGGTIDLFTPAARRLALRASRGIPRRMNIICHNALVFAYGRGLQKVTRGRVRAAVRERRALGLKTSIGPAWLRALRRVATAQWTWLLGGATVVLAALIMVRGVSGSLTVAHEPDLGVPTVGKESPAEVGEANDATATATRADDAQLPPVDESAPAPDPDGAQPSADAPAAGLRDEASPPPAPAGHACEWRVTSGATLVSLGKKIYGQLSPQRIQQIRMANPQIRDPDRILAGDVLRFPDCDTISLNARATP